MGRNSRVELCSVVGMAASLAALVERVMGAGKGTDTAEMVTEITGRLSILPVRDRVCSGTGQTRSDSMEPGEG